MTRDVAMTALVSGRRLLPVTNVAGRPAPVGVRRVMTFLNIRIC